MALQKKDFIEIEFTGKTKDDQVFDSNIKEEVYTTVCSVLDSSAVPDTAIEKNVLRSAKTSGSLEPLKIGTGYGSKVAFETKDVFFKRATVAPQEILTFMYATKEMLLSWGIPLTKKPDVPSAFPEEDDIVCKEPSDWIG